MRFSFLELSINFFGGVFVVIAVAATKRHNAMAHGEYFCNAWLVAGRLSLIPFSYNVVGFVNTP